MSMPAEYASPAPVSTRTPARSSASSASSTWSISVISSGLMALRFSGRFKVTQAMRFSISTRTVLPPGSGDSLIRLVPIFGPAAPSKARFKCCTSVAGAVEPPNKVPQQSSMISRVDSRLRANGPRRAAIGKDHGSG